MTTGCVCTLGEKRYSGQERGNLGPGGLCPGSEGHQASYSLLCLEPKVVLRARADALLHGGDPDTKYFLPSSGNLPSRFLSRVSRLLITASRPMLLGEVIQYIIVFIRLLRATFVIYKDEGRWGRTCLWMQIEYRKRTEITQTYSILHFRLLMQDVLCRRTISLALISNTSIITDASARCLVHQRCSINIWTNEGITSWWACSSRFGPLQPMCQHAAFLMIRLQPSLIYSL